MLWLIGSKNNCGLDKQGLAIRENAALPAGEWNIVVLIVTSMYHCVNKYILLRLTHTQPVSKLSARYFVTVKSVYMIVPCRS